MRKSFYLLSFLFSCFILNSTKVFATAPVIGTQPRDTAICSGSTAWFSIAATGTVPITFIWAVSADAGVTWDTVHNSSVYSGATSDTLRVLANTSLSGYMYLCIATNGSGADTSTSATLHVDTANSGTISGNAPVCAGSTITLASTVSGGIWSNVNHTIDTVDNGGNVYGKAQGFDTVKYKVTNTCGVTTSWVVVRVDTVVSNLPITGPGTTCIGHTISLANANVYGTWAWSATYGFASVNHAGVVDGLASGTEIISYSFTNACNSIDTFTSVEVDTVLDHGTISGPSQVCAGSWIHLSETMSGGIWLSSSSSVAVTDMAGNVTGVSQGVTIISYFLSNGCGVSTATDTINVFDVASGISGLDSVGIGATRTLFDTALGGTWSTTDTAITVNSITGVVTGVHAGTGTVTYSVTNICGTSSAVFTMYVGTPNAGIIHGPDSVCRGTTISLIDTLAPGGIWTSADDTIATVDGLTGVVHGLARGIDHITYTLTNGFGTATTVTAVYVNSAPIDSISVPAVFALSGYYTFLGFTKKGSAWVATPGTWTSSNTAVGNFIGTPGFFVIYGSGTTTVHYTVHNTCGTTDTSFVVNVAYPNGVNGVANTTSELNVYPNPSTGNFTINLLSGITEQATVTITNIVGEKVKEFTMSTNQPTDLKLDQPEGIYFLTAASSTGKYSAKITITK